MPFPFSRTCCFPASVWALCCPYLVDSDVASSRWKPRRDMRSGRSPPYGLALSAGGGEGFSPALLARRAARTEKSLSSHGTAPGGVAPPARWLGLPNRHRALPGCRNRTRARARELLSVSSDPTGPRKTFHCPYLAARSVLFTGQSRLTGRLADDHYHADWH